MDHEEYICNVLAEPLQYYTLGGYHPTHLGDEFNNGQYRILHKLGYGSYSTVWLARDTKHERNIALKIKVARAEHEAQEVKIMRLVARKIADEHHDQQPPVTRLLDDFTHSGPNGIHTCFVLELLGESLRDRIDNRDVLSGRMAKNVAQQVLRGVDFLGRHYIGHADLYTRNICFTLDFPSTLPEAEILAKLQEPQTGIVERGNGLPLEPCCPRYLVSPVSFQAAETAHDNPIKIIDFGEAFIASRPSASFKSLGVAAPETAFESVVSPRLDLWNVGCLIFELIVGQPPFDSSNILTKQELLGQRISMVGNLPSEWQTLWDEMSKPPDSLDHMSNTTTPEEAYPHSSEYVHEETYTLQSWFERLRPPSKQDAELTSANLELACSLVLKLVRLDPRDRVSAEEALRDEWFSR